MIFFLSPSTSIDPEPQKINTYDYFCGQPIGGEYAAWYLLWSDMSGGMWEADLVSLQFISVRVLDWDLRHL